MHHFLIADDHPLFRAALRQALAQVDSAARIDEAADFAGVEALLAAHDDVDLVLFDLNMPGHQGLQGLRRLRAAFPAVGIAVVSGQEEPALMHAAVQAGASAFIAKSLPLDSMVSALHAVLAGAIWLPPAAANLSGETAGVVAFAGRVASLTPQQQRVLRAVAEGKLNKQIAFDLGIQETTIKQHVSAILRKLELINRTQAGVMWQEVQRLGLLPLLSGPDA